MHRRRGKKQPFPVVYILYMCIQRISGQSTFIFFFKKKNNKNKNR